MHRTAMQLARRGSAGFLVATIVAAATVGAVGAKPRPHPKHHGAKGTTTTSTPTKRGSPSPPASSAATVTASPVDLADIARISTFRSCFGHDFSGLDTDGVQESDRSMKHYFQAVPALAGVDKVPIMAPFDGSVVFASSTLDAPYGWQLAVSPKSDPSQEAIIFHIDPAPGIGLGASVKAGALLGYANPPDGVTFDIAYGWPTGSQPIPQTLDSIFNHMTASVLAEYAAHGLTPANATIPKAERDAQPCDYPNGGIGSPLADQADNWVTLH